MRTVISEDIKKLLYVDSFKKRKNNLGWKERGEVKEREEIYYIVYKDLLHELFESLSSIVIGGPSNEEVQYIKELENSYIIKIFEPNKERAKELEEILKKSEIIRDYIFNIRKYVSSNSIDCAIILNIINWIPTNLKDLLRGLNSSIRYGGKILISFYIDLLPYSKDIEYIVETPQFFRDVAERYSLKNYNYYYQDENGILKFYVIDKKSLKSILEEVNKEEYRIRKILNFLFSLEQLF